MTLVGLARIIFRAGVSFLLFFAIFQAFIETTRLGTFDDVLQPAFFAAVGVFLSQFSRQDIDRRVFLVIVLTFFASAAFNRSLSQQWQYVQPAFGSGVLLYGLTATYGAPASNYPRYALLAFAAVTTAAAYAWLPRPVAYSLGTYAICLGLDLLSNRFIIAPIGELITNVRRTAEGKVNFLLAFASTIFVLNVVIASCMMLFDLRFPNQLFTIANLPPATLWDYFYVSFLSFLGNTPSEVTPIATFGRILLCVETFVGYVLVPFIILRAIDWGR